MNGTITLERPTLATIAALLTIGGVVIGFVSNHLLFYSGIASRLTALETAQLYVGKELARLTLNDVTLK
jgi:hypothetical protein